MSLEDSGPSTLIIILNPLSLVSHPFVLVVSLLYRKQSYIKVLFISFLSAFDRTPEVSLQD